MHHPQSFEYVAEQQGRLCARSKITTIDLFRDNLVLQFIPQLSLCLNSTCVVKKYCAIDHPDIDGMFKLRV
jgi:hypothetical protein